MIDGWQELAGRRKEFDSGAGPRVPARHRCAVRTGWAAPASDGFAPSSYVGELDPNMIWELLIGGIVVVSFLAAVGLWVLTALRRAKRSQLRRSAFVSSALNNLSQGVVMTDARQRVIFCNDRYLEIYGLRRSDIPRNMTGPRTAGDAARSAACSTSASRSSSPACPPPEGLVTELPNGRSVLVKYFRLPNGGSVGDP